MALPPDEAERLLWIEGWMAGAFAEWRDTSDVVRERLRMQTLEARAVLLSALRALGIDDLINGGGPAGFESDASADYDRRRDAQRQMPKADE